MSKKHYKAIADILADVRYSGIQCNASLHCLDDITHRLADYFASERIEFNRERFLAACEVIK